MQKCGNCRWFKKRLGAKPYKNYVLGECRDAVVRARAVVPFAVRLEAGMIYAHGGKNCPCFERVLPRKDDNRSHGFDDVSQWIKKHPGTVEYVCEFCGIYTASKPRCTQCQEDPNAT